MAIDLQDILPDGGYDLDLIKSEYHRELEVEEDGESYIEDYWECPLCGELQDTEEEALACCQSWSERDPEGWKDYLWGKEVR